MERRSVCNKSIHYIAHSLNKSKSIEEKDQPKMKIQSISTQKHADEKSEMQLMTKISFLGELVL